MFTGIQAITMTSELFFVVVFFLKPHSSYTGHMTSVSPQMVVRYHLGASSRAEANNSPDEGSIPGIHRQFCASLGLEQNRPQAPQLSVQKVQPTQIPACLALSQSEHKP